MKEIVHTVTLPTSELNRNVVSRKRRRKTGSRKQLLHVCKPWPWNAQRGGVCNWSLQRIRPHIPARPLLREHIKIKLWYEHSGINLLQTDEFLDSDECYFLIFTEANKQMRDVLIFVRVRVICKHMRFHFQGCCKCGIHILTVKHNSMSVNDTHVLQL